MPLTWWELCARPPTVITTAQTNVQKIKLLIHIYWKLWILIWHFNTIIGKIFQYFLLSVQLDKITFHELSDFQTKWRDGKSQASPCTHEAHQNTGIQQNLTSLLELTQGIFFQYSNHNLQSFKIQLINPRCNICYCTTANEKESAYILNKNRWPNVLAAIRNAFLVP